MDFSGLAEQPGDVPRPVMSFLSDGSEHPRQVSCHITHTNERTHELVRASLDRSPLYSGQIEGLGPRYCPSIEDKVVRFADRQSHQIFIEPEGLNAPEVYPNGISTSLPEDVQAALVHSIKGFERARITQPGYAIEYDFFEPKELASSLETRHLEGLFFAGQINGTTGYEEAAAQGLVAGLNAARLARGQAPWSPDRSQAYMGVLIDDLVTLGAKEPYRMFTSRAEYRLILRQDNADRRLTAIGRDLGLVDDARWSAFNRKADAIEALRQSLEGKRLPPPRAQTLAERLKRPEAALGPLMAEAGMAPAPPEVGEQVEIDIKYQGYIKRQEGEIARLAAQQALPLPAGMDYAEVKGLSSEAAQKLNAVQPETLGQAGRIAGVTPAALSLLLLHVRKRAACQSAA